MCVKHIFSKKQHFSRNRRFVPFSREKPPSLCRKSLLPDKKSARPLRGRALVGLSSAQDPLLEDPAVPVLALPSAEELLSSAVLASITAWISFLAPRVRDWAFSQKAWGSIWS